MIIGSHVSFGEEQLLLSTKLALEYGCNAFMFYTGAPQNTIRRPINYDYIKQAHALMKENNIDLKNVICHAPYIINLANFDIEKRKFAQDFLKKEIQRCIEMGITKMVLHPGCSNNEPINEALKRISEGLNQVMTKDMPITILLETMAGKGSECGKTLEELKEIIDEIVFKEHIGICIDTCHLNDAGYDLSDFDEFLNKFDQIIGLQYLGCIHINDSKNELGSKKDRHANIGYGTIGFNNLLKIIYHDKTKDIPKILETPFIGNDINDKNRLYPPYKFEIEMIKNKIFDDKLFINIANFYK